MLVVFGQNHKCSIRIRIGVTPVSNYIQKEQDEMVWPHYTTTARHVLLHETFILKNGQKQRESLPTQELDGEDNRKSPYMEQATEPYREV